MQKCCQHCVPVNSNANWSANSAAIFEADCECFVQVAPVLFKKIVKKIPFLLNPQRFQLKSCTSFCKMNVS